MKASDMPMTLGRGLMAGLCTGLITALVVLAFDVIYRGAEDFTGFNVVMPISIFTAFPFLNLVIGGIYTLFAGHMRRGQFLFTVTVLVVMGLTALITAISGSRDSTIDEKIKGMVIGLEIIEGVMAAFLIPFFANHPKLFLTDNDIRGKE